MTEEKNEKNDKQTKADKYLDPKTKKFKKGNPGGGRTKGTRDFNTDFDDAVKEIAKDEGLTVSEVRKALLKVAYSYAKNGSFSFWKDIQDRVYGQPRSKVDLGLDEEVEKVTFEIKNAPKDTNQSPNTKDSKGE